MEAAAILMFGCVSILLNYMTDVQKEKFRASNGQCYIWGRPAKFLVSFEINILGVAQKIFYEKKINYFLHLLHISHFTFRLLNTRITKEKLENPV